MSKRPVFFALVCLAVSAACALFPSAASTLQPTAVPLAADSPAQPGAPAAPATSLPLPATPTSAEGRSAGIDLSGPSGTITPNVPPTLAPQAKPLLVPDEWYPLNAAAAGSDFSVTILGWGVPTTVLASESSGDKTITADPGYQYLRIDAIITNLGSANTEFWPGSQARLKDSAGQVYSPNDLEFRYESGSAGNAHIAAGEHLRHNFYFTVPTNAGGLTFQYYPCFGNSVQCPNDVVELPLAKTAASAQAPAETVTLDSGAYKLGEVITIGKVAFSVIRWLVETPPADAMASDRPPGVNLVGVNVLIANLDTKAFNTDATGGIWVGLKDKTGWYFPTDNFTTGWGGQLEPGEWMQVYFAYQAPPGVGGLEFVIDSGEPAKWPQISRTFISLGDQPALDLSQIEQMPGSIAPNPIPLGQAGAVGPFQVSVQKVAFPNTSACGDIPAGYKAVLVTASGVNAGSTKEETYAVRTFLKDSHGNQFSACNTENDSIATSGLEAGATMNLVYSFLVPDFGGEIALVELAPGTGSPKIFFALQ